MKKLKVVTIVGTRPEIIRLSRLIPKLDEHTDHVLVHTGQNYDPMLSDVFFKDLEIRQPDHYLNVDTTSFGTVMGDVIKKSEEILLKEKPDAVMILGDTNSSIAAIVAERLHIPVYHMEAGNRSFDNNVPEELNRRMVDHVSTFNLPYSEHARQNLISEGLHPKFIVKTGSPIGEVWRHYKHKIEDSQILRKFDWRPREFFLFSVHRQENVDRLDSLKDVIRCLIAVREQWKLPILVSTHPRTRTRLEEFDLDTLNGIYFHDPFGYIDYNKLQSEARCVISDSGSISEECAIQSFRAVSLRESTERPEALETGVIISSGLEPQNLIQSITYRLDQPLDRNNLPEEYEKDDFSNRVMSFLLSTAKHHRIWKGLK